jgi:hypothetical protein
LAPTSRARSRAKAANTTACIPRAQNRVEPPPQTQTSEAFSIDVGTPRLKLVAPQSCKDDGTANMPAEELQRGPGNPTQCSRWLQ